jgi:hypothetical protein
MPEPRRMTADLRIGARLAPDSTVPIGNSVLFEKMAVIRC